MFVVINTHSVNSLIIANIAEHCRAKKKKKKIDREKTNCCVHPFISFRTGTMESSDEDEVLTFVQVISEKYNPENFPYGQGVMVLPSPPGSPVKGET